MNNQYISLKNNIELVHHCKIQSELTESIEIGQ